MSQHWLGVGVGVGVDFILVGGRERVRRDEWSFPIIASSLISHSLSLSLSRSLSHTHTHTHSCSDNVNKERRLLSQALSRATVATRWEKWAKTSHLTRPTHPCNVPWKDPLMIDGNRAAAVVQRLVIITFWVWILLGVGLLSFLSSSSYLFTKVTGSRAFEPCFIRMLLPTSCYWSLKLIFFSMWIM